MSHITHTSYFQKSGVVFVRVDHGDSRRLNDPYQFGSLNGSLTTFGLIELVYNWLGSLESRGKVVRILLLDFQKAFDRVEHAILNGPLPMQVCLTFLPAGSQTSFVIIDRGYKNWVYNIKVELS